MDDYNWKEDICEIYLNETKQCCCEHAYHNLWEFGQRHPIEIPIWWTNHKYPKEDNELYLNTDEYHEKYNKYTNELCLCCETKLLELNTYRCSDCGCFLCGKCFLRGRYCDKEAQYCYSCRRFGYNKNCLFRNLFYYHTTYSTIEEYEKAYPLRILRNDWMNASWYY